MKKKDVWLINLPHAGGSITTFKGWNKKINCNVLNIEYPGHWTRMNESLLNTFEELFEDVVKTIQKKIQSPAEICLFGHSLGAILAWSIIPALKKMGYEVKCIFLSASQSPNFFPENNIRNANTDIEKLKLIGYDVEEHSSDINDQFLKTFFPILDKDLQICKKFVSDNHYIDIDAYVLYGKEDSFVDIDKMVTWGNYVKLIAVYDFPGQHLYLEEKSNRDLLTDLINTVSKQLIK